MADERFEDPERVLASVKATINHDVDGRVMTEAEVLDLIDEIGENVWFDVLQDPDAYACGDTLAEVRSRRTALERQEAAFDIAIDAAISAERGKFLE